MGCRIGWLFCENNSSNNFPSVNTLLCLSILLQEAMLLLEECGWHFMLEEFIRAFLIVAGAASGCWHLLKKSQTRNIIVKMVKASCFLCMSIQADMYKGCRGDGAAVLAVTSLLMPKCLGLRPPKVVTLGGRHEKFWRDTQIERPVSHLLTTGPFMVSVL